MRIVIHNGPMSTLTLTCPYDAERFVVVEPEDSPTVDALTVSCPSCEESFKVVYPEEALTETDESRPYEQYNGEILEWSVEPGDDTPSPYTGNDAEIPVEQYMTAEVRGLGGKVGVDEGEVFEPDRFKIWYTPDHDDYSFVVRGDLETGVKTKNVYENSSGSLFVKNRGIPRDSDKQWTYLDRNECYARAWQARLDGEIAQDSTKENRFNIFLDEPSQPLVAEDGALAEELVLELSRMLVAFQSRRER